MMLIHFVTWLNFGFKLVIRTKSDYGDSRMKKPFTKLVALFFSGILLSASNLSAQSEDSILSDLFIETGAGYSVDTGKPYYVGRLGLDRGNGSKFYFSYGRLDDEPLGNVEETIDTIGLGVTFGELLGDNGSLFYGIEGGIASVEWEDQIRINGTRPSISSDDVFYASVTLGLEHEFTENLSVVGQMRYMYFAACESESGEFRKKDYQLGFELALRLNF